MHVHVVYGSSFALQNDLQFYLSSQNLGCLGHWKVILKEIFYDVLVECSTL